MLAPPLDVTDPAARAAAVKEVVVRFARIDVPANSAGRGSLGAAGEFAPDQLRARLELNFIVRAELTREVLPHMRAQAPAIP